ncbi:hypothetical protein BDP27DRAFT_958776 [Rhodocollybia butyracea]|uniref:Uncharacterized protein n=1 Tax=Rhodocollybia butyracea TaxID=206335 RepID=A0A9P5UD38_9AGAR|nr:hypothetical protein BDP27DRAFT_958776 [Rhodocollybia butyracea]
MSYSVQSIALTFCIRVSRCLSFPDLAQHVPKHVSECPPSIDVILGSDLLKSSSAAVELIRFDAIHRPTLCPVQGSKSSMCLLRPATTLPRRTHGLQAFSL